MIYLNYFSQFACVDKNKSTRSEFHCIESQNSIFRNNWIQRLRRAANTCMCRRVHIRMWMCWPRKNGYSEFTPCLNVEHGCRNAGTLPTDLKWNYNRWAEGGLKPQNPLTGWKQDWLDQSHKTEENHLNIWKVATLLFIMPVHQKNIVWQWILTVLFISLFSKSI